MTARKLLLIAAVWFAFCFLAALAFLTFTREPALEVDSTPACAPKANPCATMRCDPKPARNMT